MGKGHMKADQPDANQIKAQTQHQVVAIIDASDKSND